MVEVMKTMMTSFKRSHACTTTLNAPSPAAGHRRPTPPLRFLDNHSKSGSVSCGVMVPFSCGSWCTHGSVCALQKSVSPVLCNGGSMVG